MPTSGAAAGGQARGGTSPSLFSCSGISLDLGGREILRGINLHVQPGEVLGIIGPNGAGKTSLFEVLSGRMQPKSGTVTFKGEQRDLAAALRARTAGHRPNLSDAGRARRVDGRRDVQGRPPGLLALSARSSTPNTAPSSCGLKVDDDEPAVRLETLNRRKLLLACLLMRRPPLLLMDEPAAGLINSEVDEIDYPAAVAVEGNEHRDHHRRASHRAAWNDHRSRRWSWTPAKSSRKVTSRTFSPIRKSTPPISKI